MEELNDLTVLSAIGKTLVLRTSPSKRTLEGLFSTLRSLDGAQFKAYFMYVSKHYDVLAPKHHLWGLVVAAAYHDIDTDKEAVKDLDIFALLDKFYTGNSYIILRQTFHYMVEMEQFGRDGAVVYWVLRLIDYAYPSA